MSTQKRHLKRLLYFVTCLSTGADANVRKGSLAAGHQQAIWWSFQRDFAVAERIE